MASIVVILSSVLLIFSAFSPGSSLNFTFYDKTCPQAESIITNAVKNATSKDNTVPAGLLRMHFHDCFVRGCDASVLLNSEGTNKAEKDGPPNINSLHTFDVIDSAKKDLEASCPGVVSCADIVALAARDAVSLAGGPSWNVPKGRKDGRTSKDSETITMSGLPAPTFNISELQQSFSRRGLSMDDLVALSGAHTIGVSHCSSFRNRIRNFSPTQDTDPSLHPTLAASLRGVCPIDSMGKDGVTAMVPSSTTFNNTYYKLVLQGEGLFSSDQALLNNPRTKHLVRKFADSPEAFRKAFVISMIKMSGITGGEEIRRNCSVVN